MCILVPHSRGCGARSELRGAAPRTWTSLATLRSSARLSMPRRVLAPNATAADECLLWGTEPIGVEGKRGRPNVRSFGLNASELELVAAASRGDDALYRFCRKNCTDMVGVPWVGTARVRLYVDRKHSSRRFLGGPPRSPCIAAQCESTLGAPTVQYQPAAVGRPRRVCSIRARLQRRWRGRAHYESPTQTMLG